MYLSDFLKNCPSSPGVYQFHNENEKIIYIGKAKNLRKRIANYLILNSAKHIALARENISCKIIMTKNEAEAFLLEAQLIKKHKPKYNVLLKDDKSFPYIVIRKEHEYPQITKYRGNKDKIDGYFYGPFPSAGKVDESLILLQKAFLLRSCSDSYFADRKRPCLLYQIKRCSAPCVGKVSKQDYQQYVDEAKQFLKGQDRFLREEISNKMEVASQQTNYELAALYRDRLKALNAVTVKQSIEINYLKNSDVICLASDGVNHAIVISFIRLGNNLGTKCYYPTSLNNEAKKDILESFMGSFYQRNIPPETILTNIELPDKGIIIDAIHDLHKVKTSIIFPKRGDKYQLINLISEKAEFYLNDYIKHSKQYGEMLKEIKDLFSIDYEFQRIEIYDNSHLFGRSAVGGRVVWEDGDFNKNAYKKYNLNNTNIRGGDDYDMLRQVLLRRFKDKTHEDVFLIIDGGKGHQKVIDDTMVELGIKIAYICVSKGRDRNSGNEIIYDHKGNEHMLDKRTSLKKFIQRLRDEAHRYAISTHRRRRKNDMFRTSLDHIPGVGAQRKKTLLNHFGSADAIKESTIEELSMVKGINQKVAETIYLFFKNS